MQTNKIIREINSKGYVILDNILNKKYTTVVKNKLEKILKKRLKNREVVGHHDNQIMFNFICLQGGIEVVKLYSSGG